MANLKVKASNKKIVIIDDSIIYAKGLSFVINNHFSDYHLYMFYHTPGFERVISSVSPFLVIVNTSFIVNADDFVLVLNRLAEQSDIKFLLIVNPKNKELVKTLTKGKIHSLISILDDEDEYLKSIKTIFEGKSYLSKSLQTEEQADLNKKSKKIYALLDELTVKDHNIVKMVLENRNNKYIADMVGIKIKSVEKSRSRICEKLNLDGENNSLTRWIFENKTVIVEYYSE